MNRKKSKGIEGVMRTCIGCRTCREKQEMVRIRLCADGLEIDVTGHAEGRGVYLCKDMECMEKAIKARGFQRGFKRNFKDDELAKLAGELEKVWISRN